MDELHLPRVVVLQDEPVVAALIHLHEVVDIHLFIRLPACLELGDEDAAHQRGSLQDLQFGLLEDLGDVVLSDEVKGQRLVGMVPRIWDSI